MDEGEVLASPDKEWTMSALAPQAGGPAPSITLGGGGGPQGASQGQGTPGAPDSPEVEDLLSQAKDLITKAEQKEVDHEDKAKLMKMAADIQAFLGTQQKLTDTVMGGGPGAKLIRKAMGTAGSATPGGGY